MNESSIVTFLLNLIPVSFSVPVPAESFEVTLGSAKIKVSTPAFAISVSKA